MTLNDYLSNDNPADFAKRIGVSLESVRRYMRGERIPKPEIMKRIAEETNGVITANSFYQ